MRAIPQLIFILVSFFASVIGSICGIGGGVIIKPVLDAFGLYSVSTISFMSGCIVLSMTTYNVLKAKMANESVIEKGVSTEVLCDVMKQAQEARNNGEQILVASLRSNQIPLKLHRVCS